MLLKKNFQGSSASIKTNPTAFSPIIIGKNTGCYPNVIHFPTGYSEKSQAKNSCSAKITEMKLFEPNFFISVFNPDFAKIKSIENNKKQTKINIGKPINYFAELRPISQVGNIILSNTFVNGLEQKVEIQQKSLLFPTLTQRQSLKDDLETPISHKNIKMNLKENEEVISKYANEMESKVQDTKNNTLYRRKRKHKKKILQKRLNDNSNTEFNGSLTIKKRRKTRKSNPESFEVENRKSQRIKAPKIEEQTDNTIKKIYSKRGRKSKIPKNYVCKLCRKKFITPSALGGHTSKAHPGESLDYQDKLRTRDKNESNRIALIQARRAFVKSNGYIYDNLSKEEIKMLIKENKKEYYENLSNFKQNITNYKQQYNNYI